MNETVSAALPSDAAAIPVAGNFERRGDQSARRLQVLMVSPFSPLPPDAGQRRRVWQMLQLLKDAELSISLLLYPFEGSWPWRFQQDIADRLRQEYDDVVILPASRAVGIPPQHGVHHLLDEWWDDLLNDYLARLFKTRHFDVLLIHNVWLSKALTLAPPGVVKVIDMHDLFHLRERSYASSGIVPEFFRIIESDELFGLNRADICISISLPEAKHLAGIVEKPKVVYLPYMPPAALPKRHTDKKDEYLYQNKVAFGFLGTSHTFNVSGIASLLDELCLSIGGNFAPIELVFAGTVCSSLDPYADRIHMIRLGRVEDESEFFDRIDFCIVPVFHGSGFKVKVADILERGKPALFSEHSAEGLSLDPTLLAADASAMAGMMSAIAFDRPPLSVYTGLMEKARRALTGSVAFGMKSFLAAIDQCIVECVIDLRGGNESYQQIALLSMAALAQELKDFVRVRVVFDRIDGLLQAAASRLPPSVSFEAGWRGEEAGGIANRVWWRLGGGAGAPVRAAKIIADLRFADAIPDIDLSSAAVILSPDQVERFDDLAAANWSCLPYLSDSTIWDPVVGAILSAYPADPTEDPPRPGLGPAVIIADAGTDWLPHRVLTRLGIDVKIVDLRDGFETARLLAALYRKALGKGRISKLMDGCTGVSPLRHLVLEMALLSNVPICTGAFGVYQEVTAERIEEWKKRKSAEDQFAFRTLLRQFDSMRRRLRRI